MSPEQVAVVLPIFWYDRLEEFVSLWMKRGNFLRFENIVLDLHYYHCFGPGWENMDHQRHISLVQRHGQILQSLPGSIVGEWSLARPAQLVANDSMEREFGESQVE